MTLELAREILSLPGKEEGLLGLYHCTRQELLQIRGVGEVKAIQLQCIGELSKRMAAAGARKGLCFHDPASIADYYMERLRHEDQEVLLCMMLDTKNQLLGEKEITRGTVNATMISPRELFLAALQFRAVHILLVHNHPSGIPEPSGDDITVTRQITVIPVCWNRESDPENPRQKCPKEGNKLKEHDADSKCIRHRPWHQYRQNL